MTFARTIADTRPEHGQTYASPASDLSSLGMPALAVGSVRPVSGQSREAMPSRLVHVVGRVTDAVFSFLGPTTAALAERGIEQTVILIDDPELRRMLPRFHPEVRLVPARCERGALRLLASLRKTLRAHLSDVGPATAVHLHGAIPMLAATGVVRSVRDAESFYFSPHGSRVLGSLSALGRIVLRATSPFVARVPRTSIATAAADARALQALTHEPVRLVESQVAHDFYDVPRHEARRPLVVTGSRERNPRSAAVFAQMAVLLSEEALGLSFNWIGSADADCSARLDAAGVRLLDLDDDAARARQLASGWLYLAPGGDVGFPVFLAEAMAAGLPCVAWDTPYHRDLIRHGETGLLCRTQAELLDAIVQLIDQPELRRALGHAARLEAYRRFDPRHFAQSLLRAYNVPRP